MMRWRVWKDYSGCPRQLLLHCSTTYIHIGMPSPLRAVLRTFKFTPDEFVEPCDEPINPNNEQ